MIHFDEWDSCYNLSWKGIITAESFAHPAKFSHALIRRIYQHLLADGLIKRGDTILDPFGGVGLGGLYAAQNGLQWIGCELEPRFCTLGQQNIELWQRKFAPGFPQWVTPILIQGDSRRLSEVIGQATAVISSPPYSNGEKGHPSLGSVNKDDWGNEGTNIAGRRGLDGKYGQSNGQLSSMSEGDISAIISSPPFAGNSGGRGDASRNGIDAALFDRHSGGMKRGTGETDGNLDHMPMGDVNLTGTYGDIDGQLGGMKDNGIRAVISSPPYEESTYADDRKTRGNLYNGLDANGNNRGGKFGEVTYGQSPNQLGNSTGNTFWAAAAEIVRQCALILPQNGIAVWVTKRYIKNGKIVDFTSQWIQLCEALGFELIHHHWAMLVKNDSVQTGLFGDDKNNRTERKSFFRLLHESKQRAAMHWGMLSNSDRTTLLALGYVQAFESYHARIAKNGKAQGITVNRVKAIAQMIAWTRDGKPFYDIDTAIDFEDVLCFRRK